MEQEINQLVQAIAIASDPTQAALHQQALGYINTLQENASTTWRLALTLFVDRNPEGTPKYSVQTRFFALRVLDDFFDNRFEPLDHDSFQTTQQALVSYIQSEYVRGSAEADATFLRNKFSHTLTLFFLCTYIDQWPTFFTDLFTLIRPESFSGAAFNHHISLLFFHIVLEISGEVADQMIKSARTFSQARHTRDSRVRDAVRERDAARINEAVLTIVAEAAQRMATLRKQEQSPEVIRDVNANIEVVDWGIRTFGSYVGWIDINLTITPTTVPLLFGLLADSSLPIRLATSLALTRIVSKGLKEPGDKLQLLKVLSLGQVLDALESKTRTQQIERGADADEGEESYREALGKLLNMYGQELAKLIDECPDEIVRSEASTYLAQALPIMLRFMADEYDDTSNTVFPLLQMILNGYKRQRKTSSEPIDDTKRSFLTSLLEVILTKMKWDEEADLDDPEEDDNAEFERLRAELRSFLDAILIIDQDLVINAIRTLCLNTIAAYTNKVNMQWSDAELGIYLVYLFGEINKSGGRGRSAFCHAPAVERDKRKEVDYSEYPLTPHGEMLVALVQSGIAGYPHRAVSLQFFETVARYPDFFKVRKESIIPVLEAMIDSRGLHNESERYRSRLSYLFHRFIKSERNDIPPDVAANILGSIRDLLSVRVKLPELDDPESDLLTEAAKSSELDSQLYLFETAGILTSLLYRTPQQQSTFLLGLVKPLLDDLSVGLQEAKKGGDDVHPIIKVHHIVMALGSIAKGFPDFPAAPTPDYILPPLDIFAQMAQAIIVCLEAMNVWRVIRDATRAAFSRIMATAGPSVTHFIPVLMDNLLTHFQPSELVDFMNFIGLLIHKLPSDMFNVLDRLNAPLYAHINALLSQPANGTDEQRSQVDTKRAYLGLLNNVFSAKLQRTFTSERNYAQFEGLLALILRILEDTSDPPSQKTTLLFFQRSINAWGQPPGQPTADGAEPNTGLPGFERFIYERLVPALFRVPSLPGFNIKDGQMTVTLHEIANTLQTIFKIRGQEAIDYFLSLFLPSQNWPQEAALDFTTKLRTLDGKNFRKYFTDFVRASQAPS